MMSLWNKMFGKKVFIAPPAIGQAALPAMVGQPPPSLPARGSPTHACLACQGKFDPRRSLCPACRDPDTSLADTPEWFAMLQAHVTAVQANDTAVQLFRAGRLDDAIAELRRGLAAKPHYATGYSNLRFCICARPGWSMP
jgi:RNA polymerase subunit RPABC4/transcription elongation factor Spt4